MRGPRAHLCAQRLRRRDERGAFVVIAALCMVAMLAMAAVAIDLANARQHRRKAQASADAAALAAAQDLPDQAKVVDTVKSYALENHDIPLSAWVGCKDEDRLPVLPDMANTNACISMDDQKSHIRVRLPDTRVETFFASVVGVDALDITASATAHAKLTGNDRVIPATIMAAEGTGNLCIENSGNNTSCHNRYSGQFGSFDSPRLNIFRTNSEKNAMVINFAMGVDHLLTPWVSGPKICDGTQKTPCTTSNVNGGGDANHLDPNTGNATNEPGHGLITGATINTTEGNLRFCGRLQRPDRTDANMFETDPQNCSYWSSPGTAGPSISIMGTRVNGRHFSYWMKPEYRNVFYPGSSPNQWSTQSANWAEGDARLHCFLSTYRFDYGGAHSKGHPRNTEFFINPATVPPGSETGDGVEFTAAQAKAYLTDACKLPAAFVNSKVDSGRFWPMFEKGAIADPRFGVIPAIKQWGNGNSTALQIVRFWGTFLYRLHTNGGGTKLHGTDAWVFEPALIETESGEPQMEFGQLGPPQVSLVG